MSRGFFVATASLLLAAAWSSTTTTAAAAAALSDLDRARAIRTTASSSSSMSGAADAHAAAAGDDDAENLNECVAFLREHMPPSDATTATDAFLHSTAASALAARAASPWAAAVPWDVFLNDVLPYRSLDEPLDGDWRAAFAPVARPLVARASSATEAASAVNTALWRTWGIVFKSDQAPEILSPSQVIAAGYGSCSALSIFLVAALRAVGVPARVAGTPSWVLDRRGAGERFNNHNWVEVYDRGAWSFLGAAEPAPPNTTWFFPHPAKSAVPNSRLHAIYAASYRPAAGGVTFPLAWAMDDDSVPALDVTQHYLDTPDPPAAAAQVATAYGGGGGTSAE